MAAWGPLLDDDEIRARHKALRKRTTSGLDDEMSCSATPTRVASSSRAYTTPASHMSGSTATSNNFSTPSVRAEFPVASLDYGSAHEEVDTCRSLEEVVHLQALVWQEV